MSDQPQSRETQRRAADPAGDLGQTEAQIEKRSEQKLKNMGKSEAKKSPAPQGAKLGQKKADREKASKEKLRQM